MEQTDSHSLAAVFAKIYSTRPSDLIALRLQVFFHQLRIALVYLFRFRLLGGSSSQLRQRGATVTPRLEWYGRLRCVGVVCVTGDGVA